MTQDFSTPSGTATYPSEPVVLAAPAPDDTDSASTKDVAKEQAAGVGQSAADAGQHVAGVAKDQASNVAAEATAQAKDLLSQTRTELQEQAATQQQRIAAGIRSLSEELGSMARNSEQSGTASQLAEQASSRAGDLAGWLEARDPGSLVQEVARFARRRPGAFLAIAAGAGLLAGRLTRGAVAAAHDDSDSASTASSTPSSGSSTGYSAPAATAGVPTDLPASASAYSTPDSDYPVHELPYATDVTVPATDPLNGQVQP